MLDGISSRTIFRSLEGHDFPTIKDWEIIYESLLEGRYDAYAVCILSILG